MKTGTLGLYLHIPFCRSKCLYCDFCSFPHPSPDTVEAYVDALCADLVRRSPDAADDRVDTVYFGGGTPTFLSAGQLCRILGTVTSHYAVDADAEITAECNPATADLGKLTEMRRAGFNRLSIGLQSVHPAELRALGRLHTFEDFKRVFSDARDAGFGNLSVDVMSGIPGQTAESWLATLDAVTRLSPEHLSAYGLIVEEGTPFFRMGERLILPDEETAERMYFDGISFLQSRNLEQYEISNFAKPGYRSRHNLKYWDCGEFLGFGPAAFSDFHGTRTGNSRDLAAYIDGRPIVSEEETPTPAGRMNEYVMLRLRLNDGIDTKEFEARFGVGFDSAFGKKLAKYVPGGFVREEGDRVALTPRGMYVSNAILSDVLDFSG